LKQNKQSFITIGELRKSILKFPTLNNFEDFNNDISEHFEREGTLETMTMLKFNNNNQQFAQNDRMFDKIRPGYSAKRYLSSWTKHWQPQLFEKLTKQGQLKVENLFEPNEIMPNLRHRIDDNLSRIPPAYRIPKHWLSINVAPLKGYRFYRIHNQFLGIESALNTSRSDSPDEVIQVRNSYEISVLKTNYTEKDIFIFFFFNEKVVDKDGNDIEYNDLTRSDQEIVLTELLLQSAIHSITENRIVSINFDNVFLKMKRVK
jgi:hypothetical protein